MTDKRRRSVRGSFKMALKQKGEIIGVIEKLLKKARGHSGAIYHHKARTNEHRRMRHLGMGVQ